MGEKAGADLILIETMSDTYELKAAVLAAKENSALPIMATVIFDESKKMLTGASPQVVVSLLEGLGVDALGINCGLGPKQMKEIVKELLKYASIPVIVNPNAGLPRSENGKTVFDVGAEEFAEDMEEIVTMGAWFAGGCCGTTPAHIQAMVEKCKEITPVPITPKNYTFVTSYSTAVELGGRPVIIGERINPTGKSKFKQALRDHNIDYILEEGVKQEDSGAHILDVNVGLPEIDEAAMMETIVYELQSIMPIPLQIDTTNMEAMERVLRIYNGKPMINSVNGKAEIMEQVFPLVKKYGGVVVGLALDEDGIPDTTEGRLAIAEKIYQTGEKYGIRRYGFHGTSHRYVTARCLELLGKKTGEPSRIITCHLGNGSSVTAVDGGKSVDTSMGFTPLAGLPMGTRAGDLDAGILQYLMNKYDMNIDTMLDILNKKSGVMGVSGVSSDFRDLEEAFEQGNERAGLAVDMFNYGVKKLIGAYAAAMGGVDAIIFTAGVGENSASQRMAIASGLEFMGVKMDEDANKVRGEERVISAPDSKVTVLLIPTNEELMIAMDTEALVG